MQDPDRPTSFAAKHEGISTASLRLQAAFRRGILAVLPHEPSGRSLARGLGLDKTLGWRIQRVASAPDAATVLSALPGERGIKLFIAALAAHGADSGIVAEVRREAAALAAATERAGVSHREMRAIAAGGLDSAAERRVMARHLKEHHELSVAIRGEVDTLRVGTWLMVPSRRDPSMATLVNLHFVAGLRTVRPLGSRPVFRAARSWRGSSEPQTAGRPRGKCPTIPWLVTAASTPNLGPELLQVQESPHGPIVFADPELHPARSLTLGFAETLEEVGPLCRTPSDTTGEVAVSLFTPTRQGMVDVLFHESLPPIEPTASLYFAVETRQLRELCRFPGEIEGRFVRSMHLPASCGADGELYERLLAHGARLAGHRLDEFRCFRVQLMHPPAYTRLTVRWLLPEAPST